MIYIYLTLAFSSRWWTKFYFHCRLIELYLLWIWLIVIVADNADEELIRWGWPEDVW